MNDLIWTISVRKKAQPVSNEARVLKEYVFQDDFQDAQFQVAERMAKMVDKLGGNDEQETIYKRK